MRHGIFARSIPSGPKKYHRYMPVNRCTRKKNEKKIPTGTASTKFSRTPPLTGKIRRRINWRRRRRGFFSFHAPKKHSTWYSVLVWSKNVLTKTTHTNTHTVRRSQKSTSYCINKKLTHKIHISMATTNNKSTLHFRSAWLTNKQNTQHGPIHTKKKHKIDW